MVIRFYGPFRKTAGDQIDIELQGEATLRDLVEMLSNRIDGFPSYSGRTTDTNLAAHVMFIRKGNFLKLDQRVEKSDIIDVVLPATGG